LASTIEGKKRLVDGNAMFRKNVDPTVLSRLARKHEPFVAVLGCSDSRVPPSKIFNLSLGDAFVVRVAGNSACDPSVMGSLEYAVKHLKVKVLVVLGHTGCGAVKVAMECSDLDNLEGVLGDIDEARSKVKGGSPSDMDAIAEMNVRLQLRRVIDGSKIIADAVRDGELEVYGVMYDLASGKIRFI